MHLAGLPVWLSADQAPHEKESTPKQKNLLPLLEYAFRLE